MTDQPGDYYVAESVAWIDSVEGLSDTDRAEGREILAVMLAHHDVLLHQGRVSYEVCLERARREFAPDDGPAQKVERRDAALEKLNSLPAFDETLLTVSSLGGKPPDAHDAQVIDENFVEKPPLVSCDQSCPFFLLNHKSSDGRYIGYGWKQCVHPTAPSEKTMFGNCENMNDEHGLPPMDCPRFVGALADEPPEEPTP